MITLEGLKFISELVGKLMGLKKDRKLEVAGYLKRISETLGDFGPALEKGDSGLMNQLASRTKQYAEHIVEATEDVLSRNELQIFVARLDEAAEDKQLLTEGRREDKESLLRVINRASGQFAEAAERLEATASRFGN